MIISASEPTKGLAWHDRLKLRISTIVWFLLVAGFLLALPVPIDISFGCFWFWQYGC